MDKHRRWALALRGRKGTDIWERFLETTLDRQREYLAQNGIPEQDTAQVLAEVEAGQVTAGAIVTEADREIARRQVRGELSADEAVREAIAAALDRFPEK